MEPKALQHILRAAGGVRSEPGGRPTGVKSDCRDHRAATNCWSTLAIVACGLIARILLTEGMLDGADRIAADRTGSELFRVTLILDVAGRRRSKEGRP
jgi:hypothetical protein